MCGAAKAGNSSPAFVKLLETGAVPGEIGIFGRTDQGMKRRTTLLQIGRAGALALAVTLLSQDEAFAQSSSDGVSNFLNNLFAPKPDAQQPQAGPGGAPAWSGEDGA